MNTKILTINFLFILTFLITSCDPISAQSFNVRRYTIEDGIKSNTIFDVDQDTSGKIWLAYENGISSYDGKRWTTHLEHTRPPWVEYNHIAIDEKNQIWIAPRNLSQPVKMFNGIKWYTYNINPREELPNLVFDAFEVISKGNTKLLIGTSRGLIINENQTIKLINKKSGLIGSQVRALKKWGSKIYIATENGISILNGEKFDNSVSNSLPYQHRSIKCIQLVPNINPKEKEPDIYILTEKVLGKISGNGEFSIIANIASLFEGRTRTFIHFDKLDRIYFGNENRKYYYEISTRKVELLSTDKGFLKTGATNILIDQENNLWFSTYRGLEKVTSLNFQNYYAKNGLFEDEVSAIVERGKNSFVLGHNSGITFLNGNQTYTINLEKGYEENTAKPRRVLSVCKDNNGNIYLAASERGLGIINSQNELSWLPNPGKELFFYVCMDKNGEIWTSTALSFYKVINNQLVLQGRLDKTNINIRKLFFDEANNLYVTTRNGLIIYKKGRVANPINYSNDELKNLYSVDELEKGKIILGTTDGLYLLDNGVISKFNPDGFELRDKIFTMLKDKNETWWFGTNDGVVKWTKNKLTRFSIENGLAGRETNRGAFIRDSNGYIWIGTETGLSRYDEKYDFSGYTPRQTEIYFITANDEYIDLKQPITVPYNERYLNFELVTPSFNNEKEIRYRVKLIGFDHNWTEYSDDSRIRYTNLPAGEYYLYAQVKNYSGEWSRVFKSAAIIIQTPFYKAWWFTAILLLLSVLIVRMTSKYFSQKTYSLELEKEVEQRTAELRYSENRLSTFLHNAPNFIFAIDREGKILFVNKTLRVSSPYDLIGKSIYELFPPDEHSTIEAKITFLFDYKQPLQYTNKYVTASGETRIYSSYANPLIIDGQVNEAIVISVDVTEIRQIEETLKNILDKVPLILYKSNHNSEYAATWISENVSSITGYPKEKFLTEKIFWSSKLHPDDKERVLAAFNNITLDKDLNIEYRWKIADENYKWFSDFIVTKESALENNIEYFGIWLDISERKITQIKLENLNTALLGFGTNPNENIAKLIQLSGRELNASFAVYNKIDKGKLELGASWNLPDSFTGCASALNYIVNELVLRNKRKTIFIYDTSEIINDEVREIFVNHKVKTYAGFPITVDNEVRGLLCILFSERCRLTEDDLKFISIIGSAISIEEERKNIIELLKVSLKEKDILLKEVYHRVKNNLQIISSLLFLQSAQIKDKKLLSMFKESQNRVRSMALIHEKLYQSEDLTHINLNDYLRSLIQFLSESYGVGDTIKIKMKIDNLNLDVDKAIPCGLIINELFSNTFKYAFLDQKDKTAFPEICLTLKQSNESIEMIIKDNGIGLPPSINLSDQNATLGIKLVNLLSVQLHGQLSYEFENGAKFTIVFPKSDY